MEASDQGLNPNIAYIANVLGVESFMLGENAATADEAVAAENPALRQARTTSVFTLGPSPAGLVFVALDTTVPGASFAHEQNDLLDRMITAMKQEPSEVLRVSFAKGDVRHAQHALQLIANAQPRVVVALGIEAASELAGHVAQEGSWSATSVGIEILATRSLDEILADAGLKRSVWTHLQSAMRKLK